MGNIRNGSSGRTLQGHSPQIKAKTSKQSSREYLESKEQEYLFLDLKSGCTQDLSWEIRIPLLGECLTHNFGEFPKDERESSLSEILMGGVPERYYLSRTACLGILRRAEKRGKELPEILKVALEQQASRTIPTTQESNSQETQCKASQAEWEPGGGNVPLCLACSWDGGV